MGNCQVSMLQLRVLSGQREDYRQRLQLGHYVLQLTVSVRRGDDTSPLCLTHCTMAFRASFASDTIKDHAGPYDLGELEQPLTLNLDEALDLEERRRCFPREHFLHFPGGIRWRLPLLFKIIGLRVLMSSISSQVAQPVLVLL